MLPPHSRLNTKDLRFLSLMPMPLPRYRASKKMRPQILSKKTKTYATKPFFFMSSNEKHNIIGVVIQALTFQEHDRIVSIFTAEEGIAKLVVKGAMLPKKGQGSSTTPLTLIEAICTKGRSELYSCRELSVLESNVKLRQNLKTLEAACDMVQVIASTQFPGKASPELYALFTMFLSKLPSAPHPTAVSTSFRLKTLRYEGLLDLSILEEGVFNAIERELLKELAFGRDFNLLANLAIDKLFEEKVKNLFQQSVF